MKTAFNEYNSMVASIPKEVQEEVNMEFAISDRIYDLMTQRGMNKRQLAQAIGKRPSEVTKWLSGQYNFTTRTLALLSSFFGEPIVHVQ